MILNQHMWEVLLHASFEFKWFILGSLFEELYENNRYIITLT